MTTTTRRPERAAALTTTPSQLKSPYTLLDGVQTMFDPGKTALSATLDKIAHSRAELKELSRRAQHFQSVLNDTVALGCLLNPNCETSGETARLQLTCSEVSPQSYDLGVQGVEFTNIVNDDTLKPAFRPGIMVLSGSWTAPGQTARSTYTWQHVESCRVTREFISGIRAA